MTGQTLKQHLADLGYSNINELAKLLGQKNQKLYASMTSPDIKTGLIEDLSHALGIPVSEFFPDKGGNVNNGIVSNLGSVNTYSVNSPEFIALLANKDAQLTKSQEQIDRLLGIIESINNK